MAQKPPIPAGKELPERVNGWVHAPEYSRNGHVWVGDNAERSVTVFRSVNSIRVTVYDDRASGFENNIDIAVKKEDEWGHMIENEAVWWGVKQAVDWMEQTHPTGWEHPDIEPAVFDAPPGFELAHYWMENRDQVVYYRQTNDQPALEMLGESRLDPLEPSLDTRKYLYIQTWNVSGKSTIALAPWTRAHDHQLDEIIDPPEECGLAVAVQLAREWVADQTDQSIATSTTGQSTLSGFD